MLQRSRYSYLPVRAVATSNQPILTTVIPAAQESAGMTVGDLKENQFLFTNVFPVLGIELTVS